MVSHRMIKERWTLYLTPPTKMLFFSNLNFNLTLLSSFTSSFDNYLEDYLEKLPFDEAEDRSKMVIETLRAFPSGLKILLRISENSWGTSVDCQVSSCKLLMTSLFRAFYIRNDIHYDRHQYNWQWARITNSLSPLSALISLYFQWKYCIVQYEKVISSILNLGYNSLSHYSHKYFGRISAKIEIHW